MSQSPGSSFKMSPSSLRLWRGVQAILFRFLSVAVVPAGIAVDNDYHIVGAISPVEIPGPPSRGTKEFDLPIEVEKPSSGITKAIWVLFHGCNHDGEGVGRETIGGVFEMIMIH
jgi:hypothetical protein